MVLYGRTSRLWIARFRLRRLTLRLYRSRVAWRVRLPSWLIVAVPAWFIEPWLVLPAIVLAEVYWIVLLNAAWRREQEHRRNATS
jgi:hypothetical protein